MRRKSLPLSVTIQKLNAYKNISKFWMSHDSCLKYTEGHFLSAFIPDIATVRKRETMEIQYLTFSTDTKIKNFYII